MVYICQQYNNTVFYATLYDTKNRIPVYRALELDLTYNGKRFDDKFFIEPMLATNWGGGNFNMIKFESSKHSKFGKKQALGTDYSNSGYDKGHVNPQMFNALNNDSRYATNTFTNIAPQYDNFNQNTWAEMEKGLLWTAKNRCIFPGAKIYVIVGVQPSNNKYTEREIRNTFFKGVNVPKFYWTAICCDTSTAISHDDLKKGWSFGYKADNIDKKSVTVTFDPVDKFLPNEYLKLFTDYTGNDGETIKGCQFSKDAAISVITHITENFREFPIFEQNPTSRF
ncbi:Hypothetical predicted protein [Mytilus galloprovincialis]|uniref:Uncharacterized protein n=1 Tax=Mytilus galloprovincialis TaxID=29158 RepID=A0A8B6DNT9_MYTGA|nr:Hypothetical predicted protein [Mytilus galloprovincialis]